MEASVEVIALNLVAIGLTLGILMVIADTPAYPLAIGVDLVVILYYLLQQSVSSGISTALSSFLTNPGGAVKQS